jgi:DNA-binding CsgD family transcriptional regulator
VVRQQRGGGLSAVRPSSTTRAGPRAAPDLVGREGEVARLRSILEARGSAVLVGESGIGKSTLMDAATAGLATMVGGGLGLLRFIPYLPLVRAVGPLPEADPAGVAVVVVDRVAGGVLVLDDLHWADDATLAILDRLAGRVPVVGAVRTGDEGTERALAAVRRAAMPELWVAPLAEHEAAELARRWRPGLSAGDSRRLVARSGGNPLLVVELARSGVTTTLTLALEHRLRALSAEELACLELLAIADVPLASPARPAVLARLADLGLLAETGQGWTIRHALIAEVIAGRLEARRRRSLHRRVAALTDDPATKARQLLAAGDREAARAVAAAAADTSPAGLRAALLGLAAECASGPDVPRLRVEAAEALVAARLIDDAERVLGPDDAGARETRPGAGGEVGVRRQALRAQVRYSHGDSGGALAAVEEAIALADPGSMLAARLLVERAWIVTLRREGPRAVTLAREALAAARASGLPDAAAQRVLGVAISVVGGAFDEYVGLYEAAAASARRAGDIAEELYCGKLLVASHESGDQELGIRIGEAAVARAAEEGMVGLGQTIRASLVSLVYSHGDPERAVRDGEALLGESIERRDRQMTAGFTAAALVDLGRFEEARRLIAAGRAIVSEDIGGCFDVLWAEAELALAAGDAREALRLSDAFLARFGDTDYGDMSFMQVAHDWAALDLGLDPGPLGPPARSLHRQHLPTVTERRALRLLAAGRPGEAATTFVEAADAFEPYHRRSELRCRWAAGESLRRAGRTVDARAALEEAERLAGDRWVPLARRIHRSLRLTGVRRSAPRRGAGSLTAREREVLELVGGGLTNAQIAARLGVTPRTVATLVGNAAAKLGTRSRAQTALRAAETS